MLQLALAGRKRSVCLWMKAVRQLSQPAAQQECAPGTDGAAQAAAAKPFNSMPGPKPFPVVGNLPYLYANRRKLQFHNFIDQCFRKYGGIFKLHLLGKLYRSDSILFVLIATVAYSETCARV